MESVMQSPVTPDIQFDRDDLVGIVLGGDDPIFKRGLALDNMYRGIVDESGDLGSISIEDGIEKAIDNDDGEYESDPAVLNMVPDDTELAIDAIDADQEIEAAQEILSGEADDDIDLLDYSEKIDVVKEDAGAVSAKEINDTVQDKLYKKPEGSIDASDVQNYTKTKENEEVREAYESEEEITISELCNLF